MGYAKPEIPLRSDSVDLVCVKSTALGVLRAGTVLRTYSLSPARSQVAKTACVVFGQGMFVCGGSITFF